LAEISRDPSSNSPNSPGLGNWKILHKEIPRIHTGHSHGFGLGWKICCGHFWRILFFTNSGDFLMTNSEEFLLTHEKKIYDFSRIFF